MLDTLEPLAATFAELHSDPNPLTAGSMGAHTPQPGVLVIFGAAGDLAWRKLLPAGYNLHVDGVLPAQFAVVGFGLGAEGDGDSWLRDRARDGVRRFSRRQLDSRSWEDFARSVSTFPAALTIWRRMPGGEAVSFRRLAEELRRQLQALKVPEEAPVVRARMSNLVIYCDTPERAIELEHLFNSRPLAALPRTTPWPSLAPSGRFRLPSHPCRAS